MQNSLSQTSTLIIQPLPGIGDMVWHLPMIQAIAAQTPEQKVIVMTKKRSMADQLLAAEPCVARVTWLDDARNRGNVLASINALARHIRSLQVNTVYLLHYSPRYALACQLAGVNARYGYGVGTQKWWLNRGKFLSKAQAGSHPIDKAVHFLRNNQIPLATDVPQLTIAESDKSLILQRFSSQGLPWISLGIGSSEPYKQWGADNFARLITQICSNAPHAGIFLVGGPAEQTLADAIRQAVPAANQPQVLPIIGLPLNQVAALFALCNAFVGNDTGMMNLAAACNTPAVGIIGLAMSARLVAEERNIYAVYPPAGQEQAPLPQTISVAAVYGRLTQVLAMTKLGTSDDE